MRILVTGGAGYIGSITTAHLIKAGFDVTVLDNLSKGHKESVPKEAKFIQGDIADFVFPRSDLGTIDAVMHFAAFIEVGESVTEPDKYFENNVEKPKIFIQNAIDAGIKYFVFSSSAAVYKNSDGPLLETDPLEARSPYGETKIQVERILESYHKKNQLNVCILRYFNAAGSSKIDGVLRGEKHEPETHLIPSILETALGKREKIEIFGEDYPTPDGTNIRNYVHVDDLAEAHVLALDALLRGKINFEIYNVGNQKGCSNAEVLKTAEEVVGKKIKALYAKRREGDPAILLANSNKIKRDLGWTPKYPDLKTIVESAWAERTK